MPLIIPATIACSFTVGDPAMALATLQAAKDHGVQPGAHPSFPDREHFGRRELQRTEQESYADCVYEVGALIGLAKAVGTTIRHIKPHGALYKMACRDDDYAGPIVAAAEL